ncbi:Alpha/beta hydrolase fold-1 [Dillenia turbinata]|uniref:Alpha/beta hydrolase fold-1 n=1 Tax=Dillenia turbinata TaxID=194707 RepID=A0AAN8ZV34_9MAGN
MVNIFSAAGPITNALMKHAGVRPQLIEIEPGTIMNFWIPIEPAKNKPVHTKPALLLLHSFAADGILTWQFQVMALSSKYSIYVPDFLFFGQSFTDEKERSPEFQAQCLAKGLSKLGVDKCIAVGLSYGGMVGFKMAEMYPSLVRGMVVSGSVVALTESISSESFERLGLSSWSEGLLPNTAEGVKAMLSLGTYKLPWLPNFLFTHFLEVMFTNRKQREELLEALVVSDEDFQTPHFSQVVCIY